MTRPGNLLLVGLAFAATVAFGTVTLAFEPMTPVSIGQVLPESESPLTDLTFDAYQADDEAEPAQVEEVPEPATVVSLAGLAAIAGGTLLLRLRWFRRR